MGKWFCDHGDRTSEDEVEREVKGSVTVDQVRVGSRVVLRSTEYGIVSAKSYHPYTISFTLQRQWSRFRVADMACSSGVLAANIALETR